jgi:hypothetical protein
LARVLAYPVSTLRKKDPAGVATRGGVSSNTSGYLQIGSAAHEDKPPFPLRYRQFMFASNLTTVCPIHDLAIPLLVLGEAQNACARARATE